MKLAKYLPLLLLCFLAACSDEPSKQTLLSEVENIKLSDIATPEKGGDDSSLMSELSSARSSLSSTIIALKDGRAVDQSQLNNALIAASMLGSKTVAEFFVEKGANVNARGKDELSGYTPLSAASMNKKGGIYVANFLLQKGADTNLKGKNGNTPLFFAIRSDGAATAKLLIEHGANVNAKGQNGDTPLHEAVRNDNVKAVASLIEHGADVNAKNSKKQTPLQLALDLGKTEIAEILEEHGASGASMRGKYGFGTGTSSVQTEETTTSSNSSNTSYSSSRTSSSSNSSRGKYGFGTKDAPTHSEKLTDRKTSPASLSEEEDSGSGSETPKDEQKNKTPSAEQGSVLQEAKGVPVPGYGSTTPRDDALKGILLDLSSPPESKGLTMSQKRNKKSDTIYWYSNGKNQRQMLNEGISALSTTWNIENLKKKHLVSPTTRYTTSIYIPTTDRGAFCSSNHDFTSPKGSSYRSRIPCWICYYEGYFSVPEAGEYRFVGYADAVMLVGVDLGMGKKTQTVLYAFTPQKGFGANVKCGSDWEPTRFCGNLGNDGAEVAQEENKYKRLYKGSWLHLVPGKCYPIKIAFGTLNEGAHAHLGIQKKGRDDDDNFPLFTLEKTSRLPTGRYNSSCVFKASQK